MTWIVVVLWCFFMKWKRNMKIPEKLFIIFRSTTIKYYKSFITLLQLTLALINRADVIIEKKVFFYLVYHWAGTSQEHKYEVTIFAPKFVICFWSGKKWATSTKYQKVFLKCSWRGQDIFQAFCRILLGNLGFKSKKIIMIDI